MRIMLDIFKLQQNAAPLPTLLSDLVSVMPIISIPPSTRSIIKKRMASMAIFIMLGAFLVYEEPTVEIAWIMLKPIDLIWKLYGH